MRSGQCAMLYIEILVAKEDLVGVDQFLDAVVEYDAGYESHRFDMLVADGIIPLVDIGPDVGSDEVEPWGMLLDRLAQIQVWLKEDHKRPHNDAVGSFDGQKVETHAG